MDDLKKKNYDNRSIEVTIRGLVRDDLVSKKDADCKVLIANGAAECKKALLLMKAKRLPEDFVEGMACEGGCIGGPSAIRDMAQNRKEREAVLAQADQREIHENLKDYDMSSIHMHR